MMIRFIDILSSALGLLILSPILIIISIWIKLDSSGPFFYKQLRVGKNGFDFYLFKFRSMRTGSDNKGLLTVGERDSRITSSGYFIRKYKLDELPQLINVLIGEMSLVGPRPEVRKYVDMYTEEQSKVLSVKPGVTDYASIEYSNENEILAKASNPEECYIKEVMPNKLALNMKFIQNHTLGNYFRIIFLTLKKIGQHQR